MSAVLEPATAMDLPLDPVAQAAKIVPLLREEAPNIEALGRLTPTVVDALHASGLYRTLLPRQYNGYNAGLETFVKVMETLAGALARSNATEMTVDLNRNELQVPGLDPIPFELAEDRRVPLLDGLYQLSFILRSRDAIDTFERDDAAARPWAYPA